MVENYRIRIDKKAAMSGPSLLSNDKGDYRILNVYFFPSTTGRLSAFNKSQAV